MAIGKIIVCVVIVFPIYRKNKEHWETAEIYTIFVKKRLILIYDNDDEDTGRMCLTIRFVYTSVSNPLCTMVHGTKRFLGPVNIIFTLEK